MCLSCFPALHNIFHTPVAHSLFVLKVPLNTNQTNQPSEWSFRILAAPTTARRSFWCCSYWHRWLFSAVHTSRVGYRSIVMQISRPFPAAPQHAGIWWNRQKNQCTLRNIRFSVRLPFTVFVSPFMVACSTVAQSKKKTAAVFNWSLSSSIKYSSVSQPIASNFATG